MPYRYQRSLALLAIAIGLTGCPEPEDHDTTSPAADMGASGEDMSASGEDMPPAVTADMGKDMPSTDQDMPSPVADMTWSEDMSEDMSSPAADMSEEMGCVTNGCDTTCADEDEDGDGVTDECDQCPGFDDSPDTDRDGVPDACDTCPGEPDAVADADYDFICEDDDNCPFRTNPGQEDVDNDGIGDACDPNAPPTITSTSLSPDPAYRGTTLVCASNGAADADGDTLTLEYAWSINNTPLPNETTSTLATTLEVGDSVSCTITPFDGTEYGAPSPSNTIVVQNHLPTIASVALSPASPDLSSTLMCTPMMPFDEDGEAVSLAYHWQINGADINVTSETLTSMDFAKYDQVKCIVTPADPFGDGASVDSNSVTIINIPPTLSVAQLDLAVNGAEEVTSAILDGADSDNLATELVYTLTSAPSQGTLSLAGNPLALNDTFTQNDVDNARIVYAHSGPADMDAFDVSLCDSDGACISAGTQTIDVSAQLIKTYGNVGQTGVCPTSAFFGANSVLGSDPITVTNPAELVDFNYFGCGHNTQARMMLYRFQNGAPTTLVARSVLGTVGTGSQSLALENGPVMLTPGQYLITIIFAQYTTGVANSDTNATTWFADGTLSSQPSPFNAMTFEGYSFSLWLNASE